MSAAPKILITGVTGKIGSELLRLLVADGAPVCALVRDNERASKLAADGVPVRVGDFNQPESLTAALDGIEKLYLVYPDRGDRYTAETALIDRAKQSGVKHIVKQSAFAASLEPPVSFGVSLAQTDQHLIDSGLGWTLLRPYAFMQNFLDVAELVGRKGLLPVPFGNARVGFIDSRDIAAVAQRALTEEGHAGQIYYLSGPESLTLTQVAERMGNLLKHKVRYVSPPFFIARYGMKKSMSDYEITQLKPLLKMLKAGGEEALFADVEKVCHRQPRDIDTFVQDHIEAFSGA